MEVAQVNVLKELVFLLIIFYNANSVLTGVRLVAVGRLMHVIPVWVKITKLN
jgi:hypothetical protein